jgi:hypothetical protein
MATISTLLKSIIKKIPPIQAIIAERDELRIKISQLNQDSPQPDKYPTLNSEKLELINFAFQSQNAHSFADLGGVWGVDGGYTFYTLDMFNPTKAVLVDTHPSDLVLQQSENYSQLGFIKGNFGDRFVSEKVGQVDAVFLFDVLLHQVAPDWNEVLELYSDQTRCFLIFNQQWVGSNSTVRLLDLGEDEYFLNVPHTRDESPYDDLFQKLDQKHPDHERAWRDVHHIWQWGITDDDLKMKLKSFGFQLQYYKNCGQVGHLENFENHAFVFSK